MTRPCPLHPGLHVQFYRDAQPGDDPTALARAIASWGNTASIAGVAMHSVNLEMSESEYEPLARVALAAGMQPSASWGLGDSHPELYGKTLARFAKRPDVVSTIFDMETSFENEADDPAKAERLFDAFRHDAPDAFALDQPWPVPTLHSRFPDRVIVRYIDMRSSQDYWNNWKHAYGRARFAKLRPWFAKSKATLDAQLAHLGLPVPPRTRTIQGYGWDDAPADLVFALIEAVREPTPVWCDPLPTPAFLAGVKTVDNLRLGGWLRDGVPPDVLVREFQTATGLTVDGRCGVKTMAALGVTWPA